MNVWEPDNRIEIIVKKKKVEDYHIFRKVTVIPYLEDQRILSHKMPYNSINCYSFAQSDILYEDLPTKLNSHEVPVIDV